MLNVAQHHSLFSDGEFLLVNNQSQDCDKLCSLNQLISEEEYDPPLSCSELQQLHGYVVGFLIVAEFFKEKGVPEDVKNCFVDLEKLGLRHVGQRDRLCHSANGVIGKDERIEKTSLNNGPLSEGFERFGNCRLFRSPLTMSFVVDLISF